MDNNWQQWWDLAWEPLLEEGQPWLWAERGTQLIWSGSETKREQGIALLERTLEHPANDAHALFRVALACRNNLMFDWCNERQVYQRLIEADPDNAVAYLLPISQINSDGDHPQALDSSNTRSLLSAAAGAERFDAYSGRGGSDMAMGIEEILRQQPLQDAGDSPAMNAARITVSHLIARPNLGYANLYSLCQQYAMARNHHVLDDCFSVARLAQEKGPGNIDRTMGFGLERVIRQQIDVSDPESLHLWRQSRLWGRVYNCWMTDWLSDFYTSSVAANDVSDWLIDLDELGELEAARKAKLRENGVAAGQCDAMLALDDPGIADLLGKADPLDEWMALQMDKSMQVGVL
jgi:hypothetical protein